jgi:hypothetical protein
VWNSVELVLCWCVLTICISGSSVIVMVVVVVVVVITIEIYFLNQRKEIFIICKRNCLRVISELPINSQYLYIFIKSFLS